MRKPPTKTDEGGIYLPYQSQPASRWKSGVWLAVLTLVSWTMIGIMAVMDGLRTITRWPYGRVWKWFYQQENKA